MAGIDARQSALRDETLRHLLFCLPDTSTLTPSLALQPTGIQATKQQRTSLQATTFFQALLRFPSLNLSRGPNCPIQSWFPSGPKSSSKNVTASHSANAPQ